ncbi:hypothetical protein EJB05_34282, partial [Eragrostis curvula]
DDPTATAQVHLVRPRSIKKGYIFTIYIHIDSVEDLIFHHYPPDELEAEGRFEVCNNAGLLTETGDGSEGIEKMKTGIGSTEVGGQGTSSIGYPGGWRGASKGLVKETGAVESDENNLEWLSGYVEDCFSSSATYTNHVFARSAPTMPNQSTRKPKLLPPSSQMAGETKRSLASVMGNDDDESISSHCMLSHRYF